MEETVTIPVGSVNQFARVKVTLDENSPGMSVPWVGHRVSHPVGRKSVFRCKIGHV